MQESGNHYQEDSNKKDENGDSYEDLEGSMEVGLLYPEDNYPQDGWSVHDPLRLTEEKDEGTQVTCTGNEQKAGEGGGEQGGRNRCPILLVDQGENTWKK